MVFVSYSRKDKDFVDRLAARLVFKKVHVWLDRWELNAGDSLIDRIQTAISDSDYLLVVLSKHSVESAWCKRELNVAISRELDEKRVVIVPVILDDSPVPSFLREKLHVDFRQDFAEGVDAICEAVAAGTNDALMRLDTGRYLNDVGIDWGENDGRVAIGIDMISFSKEDQHSVLVQIEIVANAKATERFHRSAGAGDTHAAASLLLEECAGLQHHERLDVVLPDNHVQQTRFRYGLTGTGIEYDVHVRCRRLGNDNGKSILYHVGNVFAQVRAMHLSRRRVVVPKARVDVVTAAAIPSTKKKKRPTQGPRTMSAKAKPGSESRKPSAKATSLRRPKTPRR